VNDAALVDMLYTRSLHPLGADVKSQSARNLNGYWPACSTPHLVYLLGSPSCRGPKAH
jgi:hypothetical protein